MSFENFYKNIEKIKYLDYEIDDNFNLLILNKFKYFLDLSLEYKLNLSVLGTIACIFHTNKLYRTIGDIDLILDYQDLKKWMKIFNQENYQLSYYGNPLEFNAKKIMKDLINAEKPQFTLKKNISDNINIDAIFPRTFKEKYFFKKIGNYKISYRLPKKYIDISNSEFFYNRKKDFDDINFYGKFFEYPKDFLYKN
jgi:hypothetical protein